MPQFSQDWIRCQRVRRFAVLAGVMTAALPLRSWAGSPRLTSIFPAAVQRGGENETTFSGSNLSDAQSLLFDAPGFEATPVKAEGGKFTVKLRAAADAQLGEHHCRVITASGISDVRLFYVTPFPVVAAQAKKKPGEPELPPQAITPGVTLFGRTQNEDQGRFEVELKKGQHLAAEVIGARLQTQNLYDPWLSVCIAGRKPLLEVDDCAFTRQDPVASFIAPEDGKYILTVKESTNSGAGECGYLLNFGDFPRPITVYPPGGKAGETVKLKLIGDAAGSSEQEVKLPASAEDRFPVFAGPGQPSPQPLFIRVSDFPNVLEAEPNDENASATATDLPLPLAFNGVIEKKSDVDRFKFRAKKGAEYDVRVFARQLRSPLDAVIDIADLRGRQLGSNDDAGGPDSYLRWKAPDDGEFLLSIHDQLDRGGDAFTYRIEVQPVQSSIGIYLPEMVQNSNQERRAFAVPKGNRYASLVRVKRTDIGGDLQLAPVDLPPGLEVSAPRLDKSVDTIPMVFEAAPDAASAAALFGITGQLTEPPKDKSVQIAVANPIDIAENGNQQAYYSVTEDRLPVAITDAIPVKISLAQPKVPILQSGSMNLKIVAERTGDFKGAISLALLYTPPGIGTAGSAQIKENETEGTMTLSANGDAPAKTWKVCVVGSADFGKGAVWFSTPLIDLEVAPAYLGGRITRTFVDQGDSTTVTVKLDQKTAFDGKAKLSLLGLPADTTAEEQEITKDDQEVKFTVKAGPNAPAATHRQLFCQFAVIRDGEPMTASFANGGVLRIDKAAVAANASASAKK